MRNNIIALALKSFSFLSHLSGLGELLNLKINAIDSERLKIYIVQGKGKKDRYGMLSEKA
jgi:integrase